MTYKPSNGQDIKIIALDLDGTLLNGNRTISPRNVAALERAAARGIEIVPTTGRFFGAMPECVRQLPFLHYAITVNGAQVYDIAGDCALARSELNPQRAAEIMAYLDRFPVVYDCYQENWGYMTEAFYRDIQNYATDPHYREMIRRYRSPVPELKEYLLQSGKGVQKIQLFTTDLELRNRLLTGLGQEFPDTAVSAAVSINVEINAKSAHKGHALQLLADRLGYEISQTMSFGDGLNDLTMIRQAGIGVAMSNACPEVLAQADVVTVGCDQDGVAIALETILGV